MRLAGWDGGYSVSRQGTLGTAHTPDLLDIARRFGGHTQLGRGDVPGQREEERGPSDERHVAVRFVHGADGLGVQGTTHRHEPGIKQGASAVVAADRGQRCELLHPPEVVHPHKTRPEGRFDLHSA